MGLFDFLKGISPQAKQDAQRQQAQSERRQADIIAKLRAGKVPSAIDDRLQAAAAGRLPWMATLTPAELRIVRSHGVKPIATIAATCWLHHGWSWILGHSQGWHRALERLAQEAKACGANAVLDVKMRTIPVKIGHTTDFSLIGTAVKIDGLSSTDEPIIATVPALEFVKLLEAGVVPTGIAVGAHYEWLRGWSAASAARAGWNNVEAVQLSRLWESVRRQALANLRQNAQVIDGEAKDVIRRTGADAANSGQNEEAQADGIGIGVLAHVNFSQIFESGDENNKSYLARHIIVATVVKTRPGIPVPHDIKMVRDIKDGSSPLVGTTPHHQSYATNEENGAI